MLEETEWHYLEAIVSHLEAKANASSGDEDDVDWDATYGGD